MPNFRILFVPPGVKAYQCGDIFTDENLKAAGYCPASMVSRGDVEETEAEATAEFPIAEPELTPEQAPAPSPEQPASAAAQEPTDADTAPAEAKDKAAK